VRRFGLVSLTNKGARCKNIKGGPFLYTLLHSLCLQCNASKHITFFNILFHREEEVEAIITATWATGARWAMDSIQITRYSHLQKLYCSFIEALSEFLLYSQN